MDIRLVLDSITFQNAVFVNFSLLGGLCASIGSTLGKLSKSFDDYSMFCLLFLTMIGFNTLGMLFFAKGLNAAPSSVHATLISSASNYVSTGIIGSLLFGEKTPLVWWLGTSLIISGIVIISQAQKVIKQKDQ